MMLRNNKKQGFTLIEIMIAVSIASAVMGMLIFMIMSSMELRKKSIRLNTAVFLAMNLMDEIKGKEDLTDNTGSFENNPGFSYSYTRKEVEYDPFSGVTTDPGTKEQNILQENRASRTTELSTGILFGMFQYNVHIYYQDKQLYELECLRGLKIEQSPK